MHKLQGPVDLSTRLTQYLKRLYDIESPFEFAASLVRATAEYHNADISTLFRVNPSKTELILEAGYDNVGRQLTAKASYELPWDVSSEEEMKGKGLTAWVAVSGEPLFIPNYKKLIKHPSHRGMWDTELHPDGPDKTFGCTFAIPLRIASQEQIPVSQSVLGVFKIERRKGNLSGIFNKQDIEMFSLIAKQLTIVIILYERAMQRVLSEARHAVAGRLADALSQIEMSHFRLEKKPPRMTTKLNIKEVKKSLVRVQDDTQNVISWLRQALSTYGNPFSRDERTISQFLTDTIQARIKQEFHPKYNIKCNPSFKLSMTRSESWDLHTVLLNILNNALLWSGKPETVVVEAEQKLEEKVNNKEPIIIFRILDRGKGIPQEMIQNAKTTFSDTLSQDRGTGLNRVFRVTHHRGWKVEYQDAKPGTLFEIEVRFIQN